MPGVLLFVGGVVTGAGLMVANSQCVKKAVEKERRDHLSEIERLRKINGKMREELNSIDRCNDARDAYRRGYSEGRDDPLTDAEKVVRSFNGRSVKFGRVAEG